MSYNSYTYVGHYIKCSGIKTKVTLPNSTPECPACGKTYSKGSSFCSKDGSALVIKEIVVSKVLPELEDDESFHLVSSPAYGLIYLPNSNSLGRRLENDYNEAEIDLQEITEAAEDSRAFEFYAKDFYSLAKKCYEVADMKFGIVTYTM